jgi:anti-anti-sigma regulatory factor
MFETARAGTMLWVTGAVLPSDESALEDAVRRFVREVNAPDRVLELSGVQFISSASAKALVAIGQEVGETGPKLRVRACPNVAHKFEALGGEAWVILEKCQKPNVKPSGSSIDPVRRRDSASGLVPAVHFPSSPPQSHAPSVHAPAPHAAEGSGAAPAPEHACPTSSGMPRAPIAVSAAEQAWVNSAQARAGLPLVEEGAELGEDLAILRALTVGRTFTFEIPGGKQEITGRVLARVGGAWVLVDTHGARKIVNMRTVSVVNLLA